MCMRIFVYNRCGRGQVIVTSDEMFPIFVKHRRRERRKRNDGENETTIALGVTPYCFTKYAGSLDLSKSIRDNSHVLL